MKIASVAHVKAKFSAYIKATGEGPVIVTRNGKAVAAIIRISDDDDLERLALAHSPKLRAILSAARGRIAAGESIPHDRLWQSVRSRPRKAKRQSA